MESLVSRSQAKRDYDDGSRLIKVCNARYTSMGMSTVDRLGGNWIGFRLVAFRSFFHASMGAYTTAEWPATRRLFLVAMGVQQEVKASCKSQRKKYNVSCWTPITLLRLNLVSQIYVVTSAEAAAIAVDNTF
jgi:hypothetical protein